jgi:hypothetical protein
MTPHNLKLPPKYSGNESMHGNLMQDGYCILPGAVPTELMAAIEADLAPRFAVTPYCEGGFYGERKKRFDRLLVRSEHVAAQRGVGGVRGDES